MNDRTDTDHIRYVDLLAPFALDALDDDERIEVAEHVATCSVCAAELDELLDTAAIVSLGESEAPPASLWGRIVTDMSTGADVLAPGSISAQHSSAHTSAPQESAERQLSADSQRSAGAAAPVIDLAERASRRRPSRWMSAVAGAAAAVALSVPITRATLTPEPKSGTPNLEQLAVAQATQPGSRQIDLVSTDGITRLGDVVLAADGRAYLRMDAADTLPADRTYQLWTVVDGKPVSAGLLGPSPTVAAFLVSPEAVAVAVSVERAGGASTPEVGPIAVATF
jgi:hypothetical protein